MPNSAKVIIQSLDGSFQVSSILRGIAAVSVDTLRGPYGHDGSIITSWAEFVRKYGGELTTKVGPTLVKRALDRGASLRINKIGHYTTASDLSTLDATKATWAATDLGSDAGSVEDYFTLAPKYAGADYNNLVAVVADASNGDADSFNLSIQHINEPSLNELYENLKIIGEPTVDLSDYLDDVKAKSELVDVTYLDTSGLTGPLRPVNGTFSAVSGSDGTALVAADYVGDAVGSGFYAFDNFDDFEVFASLGLDDDTILNAGASYAAGRQDCVFFGHLPNSDNTTALLTATRDGLTFDTQYAALFCGGLKISDPIVPGAEKEISELGDVIGVAMRSSAEFGEWYSFAGPQRGLIYNALGVVNNFGTGSTTKLDALAQRTINTVIQRDGRIMVWGNFSGQLATSRKSFLNVVKLNIHMKKSLRPLLEAYIEQPNDFRTFKEIANAVGPYLDSLVGEKRALVEYSWRGDQTANDDSGLQVNTRPQLDLGKYTVELYVKEIVSLQEFTLKIISAPSGVSFEDNLN